MDPINHTQLKRKADVLDDELELEQHLSKVSSSVPEYKDQVDQLLHTVRKHRISRARLQDPQMIEKRDQISFEMAERVIQSLVDHVPLNINVVKLCVREGISKALLEFHMDLSVQMEQELKEKSDECKGLEADIKNLNDERDQMIYDKLVDKYAEMEQEMREEFELEYEQKLEEELARIRAQSMKLTYPAVENVGANVGANVGEEALKEAQKAMKSFEAYMYKTYAYEPSSPVYE